MNVVPFRRKAPLGQFPAGHGLMIYDRVEEVLRFAPNFKGDETLFIAERPQTVDVEQDLISRIHFQKALFGGGAIIIRLRGGKENKWYPYFRMETLEIPIAKRDVEKAEELIKEVKFDLFEDTLDDMLDATDETLGY